MFIEERRRIANKLYFRYLRKRRNVFLLHTGFYFLLLASLITLLLSIWQLLIPFTQISSLPWLQYLLTGIIIVVQFFFLHKFYSAYKLHRILEEERKMYRGTVPKVPTESIKSMYLNSFISLNNLYWMVFSLIGLAVISAFYSVIAAAIWKAFSGSPKLFEPSTFSSFNISNFFGDIPTGILSTSLLSIPHLFLLYFLLSLRGKSIRNALENIYPKEEIVDLTYLEFKVHNNNKRNKMYVFIFLCILGFIIYFFFKKIILAVFNKSFN